MHSLEMPGRRRATSGVFQCELVAFCRGARRYLQELQNDDRFCKCVVAGQLKRYVEWLNREERRQAVPDDLPTRKLKHNLAWILSPYRMRTQAVIPPALAIGANALSEFEDGWVELEGAD
jgi:hypothetical protein